MGDIGGPYNHMEFLGVVAPQKSRELGIYWGFGYSDPDCAWTIDWLVELKREDLKELYNQIHYSGLDFHEFGSGLFSYPA
jgi:hypothetical protein